ncbi:MAG: [protein-PII] uridylyltransferase [Paracoccaceae bacterium]|nr:[protein-PII] uridylyltransferase [Paracoccaceae bacterium]
MANHHKVGEVREAAAQPGTDGSLNRESGAETNPAIPGTDGGDGPRLVTDPERIIEPLAIARRVTRAASDTSGDAAVRRAVSDILAEANRTGRAAIRESYLAQPFRTAETIRSYTWLIDGIVKAAHQAATGIHGPSEGDRAADNLAVLAVGGYGRAEMAPRSDVDILFLVGGKPSSRIQRIIEFVLYVLWDTGLKVGQATRSVGECLSLGKTDQTIRTALLECRHICGDRRLSNRLDDRLWRELFSRTASEFVEGKLRERAERHHRQGGQRYMLEPNVKEGKGGLRDLQSLYWITKYLSRARHSEDMVAHGFFTHAEYNRFAEAERFLWTVRCHLHLATGRASDQLTYDRQVEIAQILEFEDRDGLRGVEHFMQTYFRHATHVGELTRIFLTKLEAQHVKRPPARIRLPLNRRWRDSPKAPKGYVITHGRLAIADEQSFLADPLNLLRIFEEGLRSGILIHPDAMRLITANLHRIDDGVRNHPEARKIFMDLMLKYGNPERALRRMNELGVLATFIPEFQPIVALSEFSLYHKYTVDEHTIQCISNLNQIEHGELVESLPVATGILRAGVNRRVLYVALLLHDIGKGRPEHHSVVGARIAEAIAPRLGLDERESETVVWLVSNHLLMSDVVQKRDLSDPQTVLGFARKVQSPARLNLLTVLTVCDIRGVGPGTWTSWKAQQIRDLHALTRRALLEGTGAITAHGRVEEAKSALAEALSDWSQEERDLELGRHYDPYWLGLDSESQFVVAGLLRQIGAVEIGSPFNIDLSLDAKRDVTRACFVTVDHPGVFASIAGALAITGANVLDARTYTSSDGYATSVFWVHDVAGGHYDTVRLPWLHSRVAKALINQTPARGGLRERDKIKKRERGFIVPTEITFDNDGSAIYTIIEVDTRDRPGLLYDLTRTLSQLNIRISSAVIATYGAQAVDVFYVKDMFGLKIRSATKQETLRHHLRDAIDRGAKQAVR